MKKPQIGMPSLQIPQKVLTQMADHIAQAVVKRIPKDVFKRRKGRGKQKKFDNPIVLDTSAIIDGRIAQVAKLGFLTGPLIVPDFILTELKYVADSQDTLKRARGRRGLELLEIIKKTKGLAFKVLESKDYNGERHKDIDERLLVFTKKLKARLITCDFNLNRKATLEGVRVLNINELINALKTIALPGEEMEVALVSVGKGKAQGVGYLPDGTMVVVEDGVEKIGKTVAVVVSRIFQTNAGKMIFAKLKS